MSLETLSEEGLEAKDAYTYINPENIEILAGITYYLTSVLDQVGADLMLNNPEIATNSFTSGMEGINVLSTKGLPELNEIGDNSTGFRVVAVQEGVELRMDFALFRRGSVFVILVLMYPDGTLPSIELSELAQKLDDRISRMTK